MKQSNKQNKSFQGGYFLGFVVALYIILFFIRQEKTIQSLQYFIKNTAMVIPIFIFVILLTAVINYYFPKERIAKLLQGKSKVITYAVSLMAGIISHGPVFAWFPLLKNLKDKGLQDENLIVFLFARGIKLTLLPVMITFFGLKYSLIFMFFIAVAAVLQGLVYAVVDIKNK